MDRDEYPGAVHVGEAPAVASIPTEESVEDPMACDSVESTCVAEDSDAPEAVETCAGPQAVPSEEDAGAVEVEPAHVIEALLFASDVPLSAGRLAELAGMGSAKDVRAHIETLNEKYAAVGLSFRVEAIARGYQMLTLPAYRTWLAKLDKHRGQSRLSAAALEALSIVAYKQPVIRADIESIRGVACGDVLNRLREAGLIKIIGRAEIVGRPMMYGTTRKFLDVFGLADLEDLPPMETLTLRGPARPASAEAAPEPVVEEEVETPVAAAGA